MKMVETPQSRYDAAHTKRVQLKLNTTYDADILDSLAAQPRETGGKQGYIKRLIREDIRSSKP